MIPGTPQNPAILFRDLLTLGCQVSHVPLHRKRRLDEETPRYVTVPWSEDTETIYGSCVTSNGAWVKIFRPAIRRKALKWTCLGRMPMVRLFPLMRSLACKISTLVSLVCKAVKAYDRGEAFTMTDLPRDWRYSVETLQPSLIATS